MVQNQNSSLITTTSAIIGGLGKALTSHIVLLNVSFHGVTEVAIYAAVSALVGYSVKKGIDAVVKLFKRPKKG